MSRIKVLALDFCSSQNAARLKSILKSSFDCDFKTQSTTATASQIGQAWRPDLILWLEETCDSAGSGSLPGFEAVPTILVLSASLPRKQVFRSLPEQVDYVLIPPFEQREVVWISRQLVGVPGRVEKQCAEENILQEMGLKDVIGRDPAFLGVISKIPVVADSEATILITGETGVGKEICARAAHYLSNRSSMPFIPVNCGAIPSTLLQNELFGHQRGAFTDARTRQVGMIAEAEGGTLFLDEIQALSFEAQSALLRLLQDKTYRPLGLAKQFKANIRIIAATNADLKKQASKGQFRADLFYRLTISLRLPSLRERKSDIPLLAQHIIKKYAHDNGQAQKCLSSAAEHKLLQHDWPGNVRELENILQEAILLTHANIIPADNLHISSICDREVPEDLSFTEAKKQILAQFEKDYISRLLNTYRGNISQAARHAMKDRRNFARLVQKYRLDVSAFKVKEN